MLNKIMRNAFMAILVLTVFIGCSESETSEKKPEADSIVNKIVHTQVDIKKTSQDSLILVTVSAVSLPDSIELNIDQAFQRIHVIIRDVSKDSLQASLSIPGTGRNLRINQIITADGNMDGPFGHDIRYATPDNGTYTLVIGKDNMADGQVQGPVTIYLRLF